MIKKPNKRSTEAVEMLLSNGAVDGAHHKMWAIDQALRILLEDDYEQVIRNYEQDGEYSWDEGIAP